MSFITTKGNNLPSNIEKFKKDVEALLKKGRDLHLAIQSENLPIDFEREMKKQYGNRAKSIIAELPNFANEYQTWYSEAKAMVKVILPDRLSDFVRHYEKPKPRKDITFESYRIEDALQGLTVNSVRGVYKEKVVGPEAAIPHLYQQIQIVRAAEARFNSSLFDIRQVVQADLFDSELAAAKELAKNGFLRPAGALAGVVLERHLGEVTSNHNIKISKKNLTIADFNDALKTADVLSTADWRFIQHLGDLRNLCDHDKKTDPTKEDVSGLISGVEKITKTLF